MQQNKPEVVVQTSAALSQGDSKSPVPSLYQDTLVLKDGEYTSESNDIYEEFINEPDTFGEINEENQNALTGSLTYLNKDAPDDDNRIVHLTDESSCSNFCEDSQTTVKSRRSGHYESSTSYTEGDHTTVKHCYEIFNIEEDLTTDDIISYLESLAGPMKDVTDLCSNETSFIVEFEKDQADNLKMGEHEFLDSTFSVRPMEDEFKEDKHSKSIVVMGISSGINEDTLQFNFSSVTRGGGPVERVKVFSQKNEKVAIVTFEESSVASHLSEIGHFKIKKNEVKLIAYNAWRQPLKTDLPRSLIAEDPKQKSSMNSVSRINQNISNNSKQQARNEEDVKLHQTGQIDLPRSIIAEDPKQKSSMNSESRINQNISNNSKQQSLNEEYAKLHQIECTVRIKVTDGCENMKIDTLERYAKKNGGEIAGHCKKICSDTFEFQFKLRKDAQKFLSCEHVLGGKTLIVQKIPSSEFVLGDAPMEDLEPDKILVKWTEGQVLTRDDLNFYMAEVTDSKEPKICYVPKPNTAIVELGKPWDAETLKRKLKTNNLFDDESVNVTATPLKKAHCIALPGFSMDDPQSNALQVLQYYFDNPEKGGDKDCEVDLSGSVPLVHCPNGVVASRLASMRHKFRGKEYSAVLVYEEVGIIPPDFNTESPFLEPPSAIEVDCNEVLFEFFMEGMTSLYVNEHLKTVHAMIDSSQQKGRLRIKCLLKKEMADYQKLCFNWESRVNNVMANITNSLAVHRFRTIEKTWGPLKQKLNFMPLEDFEAIFHFEMDDTKKEIKLIAMWNDMTGLKERINKMIRDITKDVDSTDHEEEFQPLHLEYLRKNGELEKVKERFPVEIFPGSGSKSNCLMLTGTGKIILDVIKQLRSTVEKLHEANVDVSKNIGELLQTGSFATQFLDNVLGSTVLHVTGGNKVTFVGNKHQVDEAKTALKRSIKESKVFFRPESRSLIDNIEWQGMLDSIEKNIGQNKFSFCVNMAELRVELASLTEDAKTLKESFISFFETHTVWKERVALTEGKLQILLSDFYKDITALQEKMNSKRASIEIASIGVILKGNKRELQQMRTEIDDILSKLHMHKETITGVGAKALGQEMAKHFCLSVERDCKVLVEILHSNSSKSSYETTENGVSVKVLVGSMHECPADVLVDPANEDLKHGGGLAQVLADAGGPIVNSDLLFSVKLFGKVKVGEIRATTGGMLPCKVLYHAIGPQYKKKQSKYSFEQELHQTTSACLDKAAKDGYQSIALPLISAGQYGAPIKVVAKCMGQAVADFVNSSAGTDRLKKIVVIDYDQKKTEELVRVLQGHFGKGIAKLPQRPMAASGTSEMAFRNVLKENDKDLSGRDAVTKGKITIGQIGFEVLEADITEEITECIVNGTNLRLDLGRGRVSQAIVHAAGNSVVQECKRQGKVQANGTFMSGPGNLKCRKICHLNVGHDNANFKENVKTCLQEAEIYHLKSISFPALGTGRYQKDPGQMATLTMEAIAEFSKNKPKRVKEIRVCIFDRKFLDVYLDEMQKFVVESPKTSSPSWHKKIIDFAGKLFGKPQEKDFAGELFGKPQEEDFAGKLFGKPQEEDDNQDHDNQDQDNQGQGLFSEPEEKRVELCITYTQERSRYKAIEMIKDFCQSQEKTTVIGGWKEKEYRDTIKKLDTFKEHLIKTDAKKLDIEIGIEKRIGKITLKGYERDVTEFFMKVKEILRKQKEDDEKAKMLAEFVEWRYEKEGKFEAYPQHINLTIEEAHKKGNPCASWSEYCGDGIQRKFTVNFELNVEEDDQRNRIKVQRLSKNQKFDLPMHWTPMMDTERCKLVKLSPFDTEYKDVEKAFRNDVKYLKIHTIERIQNNLLYQRYFVHKKQMDQNGNANEKSLWHGTSPDVVDNIIANGFNRSYSGVNGVAYGQGVYFAQKASYSAKYMSRDQRVMFQAKVLVGQCVKGDSSMKEPPLKPGTEPNERYDTTGNATTLNPEIAVVYHDSMCYPAYLLTIR